MYTEHKTPLLLYILLVYRLKAHKQTYTRKIRPSISTEKIEKKAYDILHDMLDDIPNKVLLFTMA